jgi:ribosomal protein S18 acetylase RimI-like enzyme
MTATTQLHFAPARESDAALIAEIARDHIEHGLRHAWTTSRVRAAMRHRESVVLAARAPLRGAWPTRAEFAGFAIMDFGEERAHLNLLAVTPPWRRRGVARGLLAWLERSAVTAGIFDITLEVRAGNHEAQSLYLARGYEPVRRIARYYQGVEDAIRMQRDLRTPTT